MTRTTSSHDLSHLSIDTNITLICMEDADTGKSAYFCLIWEYLHPREAKGVMKQKYFHGFKWNPIIFDSDKDAAIIRSKFFEPDSSRKHHIPRYIALEPFLPFRPTSNVIGYPTYEGPYDNYSQKYDQKDFHGDIVLENARKYKVVFLMMIKWKGFLGHKLFERDESWRHMNAVYSEFLCPEWFWYFFHKKYKDWLCIYHRFELLQEWQGKLESSQISLYSSRPTNKSTKHKSKSTKLE